MKIVHICLAAFYVEGLGYQENILSQLHAEMGNEVTVLTSDYVFNSKHEVVKRDKTEYTNDFGVHVKVLKKSTRYGYYSRYGDFDGVYDAIKTEKPDIIFVHGGQFVALKDVIKYCKEHRNTLLYIDQHGDYYNTKVNTLKDKIAQYCIYGHWMRKAIPLTQKFWGVTPWRCQYLKEIYGIPENKIGLLVMGGDARYIHFDKMSQLRTEIRKQITLNDDDFVVITGGKIDSAKNIHLLMQAISELNNDSLKLIVFGEPNDSMKTDINRLSEDKHIRNIGWLDSTKVYDYFLASDLAVFPGTHSVLWEQACACGIPCVFKDWEGMHHVDVGGNCEFLYKESTEEIMEIISQIFNNKEKYNLMRLAAQKGIKIFSYNEIAKRAIGDSNEYKRN